MAIVKYGPLVSEVRGSIGGTTFTAGRFGNVVRQRRSPIHAPTVRRHTYKSLFATVIAHWVSTLNQGQRDAWDTLAAATDFTNSLGETYHPTGLNLYVRSNVLLLKIDGTRQDTAPATAVGDHMLMEYQYVDLTGLQARRQAPPTAAHTVAFWLSLPASPSVKFYVSPWLLITYKTTDALAAWQTIFDIDLLVHHQRYFLRDRGIYTDGKITAPYIQTIIAD